MDAAAFEPLPYGMFRAILLALRRRRQMKAMKAITERKTVTVGTTAAAISGPARWSVSLDPAGVSPAVEVGVASAVAVTPSGVIGAYCQRSSVSN